MTDSPKPAQPFGFDVSFDAPLLAKHSAEEAAVEEAQPTFSLNDLEEAREEGFADGRQAALEASTDGIEERIAGAIEAIAAKLAHVDVCEASANGKTQALSVDLLRRITQKLLPVAAEKYGLEEIEQVLKECLPLITGDAKLSLRINDKVAPEVERRLNDIIQINALLVRVNIIPDINLGPSDCIVNWGDGGAERDYDSIWGEIDTILTRAQETDREKEKETTETSKKGGADTSLGQVDTATGDLTKIETETATETYVIEASAPEPDTVQNTETLEDIEAMQAETPTSEPSTAS
jgi:flagellar assembly protein FliH